MQEKTVLSDTEGLLQTYLGAGDPSVAGEALSRLVFETAEPIIRRIVGFKLGTSPELLQDAEDICGEVILELLSRLEEIKSGESETRIENFTAYVAVSTYHACNQYFRSRYPQRHLLKNRLRYLFKNEAGLALWEASSRDWLCGYAGWRHRVPAPSSLAPDWSELGGRAHSTDLSDLVTAMLDQIGQPVEFDWLIGMVAQLQNVKDVKLPLEAGANIAEKSSGDASASTGQRQWLTRVWGEITQLPVNQRTALLLNLRDDTGDCPITLFPVAGIATIRQIAAALEMPAEEFAELWNRLPIDDMTIAGRLGLTRQQVINLRKSARQRLVRRLGGSLNVAR